MKAKSLVLKSLAAVCLMASSSFAAVTVAHVENSTVGEFLSSTGAALTAGGVSVGYFTGAVPSDATIKGLNVATAFADLVALGYTDVRNPVGATPAGGFDWAFPTIAGTVQNIPIASLPQGTQLFILAFNAGSYVSGTAGTPSTTSSSFAGATEWAVVKDPTYTGPADSNTRSLLLNAATGSSEILVGSDNGANSVNLAAAVPEPSRALLGMIGLVGLFIRRRR